MSHNVDAHFWATSASAPKPFQVEIGVKSTLSIPDDQKIQRIVEEAFQYLDFGLDMSQSKFLYKRDLVDAPFREDPTIKIHLTHIEESAVTYTLQWKDCLQRLCSSNCYLNFSPVRKIDTRATKYTQFVSIRYGISEEQFPPDRPPRHDALLENYNSQIFEYCKRKERGPDVLERPTEACQLFNAALAEGITPNLTTFNGLMLAYAKRGDLQGLDQLRKEMQNLHIEPDRVSFNTLMEGYANAADPMGAHQLLYEMRGKGIKPNSCTYSQLMTAYLKANQVDQIRPLFEEMLQKQIKPDAFVYSRLITTEKILNNTKNFLALIREIEESHLLDNPSDKGGKELAFQAIDACMHFGRVKTAKEIFSRLPIYKTLMHCLLEEDVVPQWNVHYLPYGIVCLGLLYFMDSERSSIQIIHGKGLHSQQEPFMMRDTIVAFIRKCHLPMQIENTDNEGVSLFTKLDL